MAVERSAELRALIGADAARMRVLRRVHALHLPDCWVAAGFVRSLVWDTLHDRAASPLPDDIDVVWFDAARAARARDAALEALLRGQDDLLGWSVKNQARMHGRNGDAPYRDATHAMAHWPETATAVGVRLADGGGIEIAAPFGLDDLFGLVVRPTPRFSTDKAATVFARMRDKRWQAIWPRLALGAQDRQV
jgi:hypothetical protein